MTCCISVGIWQVICCILTACFSPQNAVRPGCGRRTVAVQPYSPKWFPYGSRKWHRQVHALVQAGGQGVVKPHLNHLTLLPPGLPCEGTLKVRLILRVKDVWKQLIFFRPFTTKTLLPWATTDFLAPKTNAPTECFQFFLEMQSQVRSVLPESIQICIWISSPANPHVQLFYGVILLSKATYLMSTQGWIMHAAIAISPRAAFFLLLIYNHLKEEHFSPSGSAVLSYITTSCYKIHRRLRCVHNM